MAAPSGRAGHNRRASPYDTDDAAVVDTRLTTLEHSMGVVQHGVAAIDEVIPGEIQNIQGRLHALEQLVSHFPTEEWCRTVDARFAAGEASRQMQREHLLLKIKELQHAVCQLEKPWFLRLWENVKQRLPHICPRRSKTD